MGGGGVQGSARKVPSPRCSGVVTVGSGLFPSCGGQGIREGGGGGGRRMGRAAEPATQLASRVAPHAVAARAVVGWLGGAPATLSPPRMRALRYRAYATTSIGCCLSASGWRVELAHG